MIDEDEEYGLRCTMGQLESERDGYAGELTRMGLEVGLLRKKNVELLHANERLRELVRDMFRDFVNADDELKQRHGRTFMAWTRYEPRLRELGVESEQPTLSDLYGIWKEDA